ncbi:Thioredoxin-like fold [Spirosomataceae bacterium]
MWCTLCLGVISIFFFEAALTFSFTSFITNSIEIQGVFNIAIGFLFPTAFLVLYKSTATRAQESKSLKKELTKLKSNPQIFEALMAGQREMPEIPANLPVISIGNINANQTITMVSNPLCTPCAHMHVRIEKILQENENLKCQIIFLSNTDKQDAGGQFVRKLFSLPDELKAIALHEWFGRNDKNFDRWNEGFQAYETRKETRNIQDNHNSWANLAEIKGTPTVFFNNRLMLAMVQLEDLSHFTARRSSILN